MFNIQSTKCAVHLAYTWIVQGQTSGSYPEGWEGGGKRAKNLYLWVSLQRPILNCSVGMCSCMCVCVCVSVCVCVCQCVYLSFSARL